MYDIVICQKTRTVPDDVCTPASANTSAYTIVINTYRRYAGPARHGFDINLGPVSISNKTSCFKISQSLEPVGLYFKLSDHSEI